MRHSNCVSDLFESQCHFGGDSHRVHNSKEGHEPKRVNESVKTILACQRSENASLLDMARAQQVLTTVRSAKRRQRLVQRKFTSLQNLLNSGIRRKTLSFGVRKEVDVPINGPFRWCQNQLLLDNPRNDKVVNLFKPFFPKSGGWHHRWRNRASKDIGTDPHTQPTIASGMRQSVQRANVVPQASKPKLL